MCTLPKDCTARKIGARARAIVHYQFNSDIWEYRENTGVDVGADCVIELAEGERWTNKKLIGQIKGTKNIKTLKDASVISYPLEIKTINYALSCPTAFLLFVVDVIHERVYYLALQDYFIAHPNQFEKLHNQKTLNLHIAKDNILSDEDFELQEIAKSIYTGGPSNRLKRIE